MLAKLPVSIKPVTRPRRKNKNLNFSQLCLILKPESYKLCEKGRRLVPTKLLALFTSCSPTPTLPVVLLSNFRTRDVCRYNV